MSQARAKLESEAYVQLQRLAHQQRSALEPVLAAQGVSGQQYNALRILRDAGGDGLPLGEIARQMIERDPDITRLADRLEAQGWVRRERNAADRRQVVARLTPAGLRIVNALDAPVAARNAQAFAAAGSRRLADLVRLLRELALNP